MNISWQSSYFYNDEFNSILIWVDIRFVFRPVYTDCRRIRGNIIIKPLHKRGSENQIFESNRTSVFSRHLLKSVDLIWMIMTWSRYTPLVYTGSTVTAHRKTLRASWAVRKRGRKHWIPIGKSIGAEIGIFCYIISIVFLPAFKAQI
jgi:hypothetical protein